MLNTTAYESVAIIGALPPSLVGVGSTTTAYIKAALFDEVMAIISTGAIGTDATIDAKLVQATASNGAGVKDVAGKTIVQMVQATDANKHAIINLRTSELDITGGFNWIAVTITVAAAGSAVGVLFLGVGGIYYPAINHDSETVHSVTN